MVVLLQVMKIKVIEKILHIVAEVTAFVYNRKTILYFHYMFIEGFPRAMSSRTNDKL